LILPLTKFLGARFLLKLQDYLDHKVDRSQIGFIQKMGIQMNFARALEGFSLILVKNSKHDKKILIRNFINLKNKKLAF